MIRSCFLFFLLSLSIHLCAQTTKKSYTESQEDFLNPERGFYLPLSTRTSHFVSLSVEQLKSIRNHPQKGSKASYSANISLIYRSYELDNFKDRALSADILDSIQQDFDRLRAAGLKIVLRFAYVEKSHTGDCPDEYKICTPYGDAPRHIVLQHISQLKPLLHQNADIIAVMQEGFIGIWGENYYTDYFGDASFNGPGKILDSSWLQRNEVLQALLRALPETRMIQVRTPQIKQKFLYGPSAPVTSAPLQTNEGFSRSDKARLGFHNDCFLSSPDDYGTYFDYGSTTQPRQPAAAALRAYIESDTRFTAVGGETCDDTYSPQNDCAPAGHAEDEMRRMHYSLLNASYNNAVDNDWDSAGCMTSIKRKLGYRFVLKQTELPATLHKTDSLVIKFSLENIGYAAPYNARPVALVLRNTASKKEYRTLLKANAQFWFTGLQTVNETWMLPAGIVAGNYQVLLSLADADQRLAPRPEYSIRLANENCWESNTGYNDLKQTLRID